MNDATMQPLSFSQSLRRAAAYIVDLTGILLVPFNKKKRALHDVLAKTFVVRIKAPRHSEALLILVVLAGNFILGIPLRLALRSHLQAFRIPTGGFKSTILIGDYIVFVPRKNIVGKAGVIYLSWNRSVALSNFKNKIRWSRIGKVLQ